MESVSYVVTLLSGKQIYLSEESAGYLSDILNYGNSELFSTVKDLKGSDISIRLSSVISIEGEVNLLTDENPKRKPSQERLYSEKEVIDFGKYLLSEQRFISIAETISEIPSYERLKKVTDADLQNFFNK